MVGTEARGDIRGGPGARGKGGREGGGLRAVTIENRRRHEPSTYACPRLALPRLAVRPLAWAAGLTVAGMASQAPLSPNPQPCSSTLSWASGPHWPAQSSARCPTFAFLAHKLWRVVMMLAA